MPSNATVKQAHALAVALERHASPVLFAAAGDLVAHELVRSGERAPWFQVLVDAMATSLRAVRHGLPRDGNEALRIDVAAAAAVLGVARPAQKRRAEIAMLGVLRGLGPALWQQSVDHLATRAMIELAAGRLECAQRSLDALLDRTGESPFLHNWVLGRVQGPLSGAEALQHLLELGRRTQVVPAQLLIVAGFALRDARTALPDALTTPSRREVVM